MKWSIMEQTAGAMKRRVVFAAAAATLFGAGLTGCADKNDGNADLVLQENAELRQLNAELESQVGQEIARADALQKQLDDARARAVAQPAGSPGTGFEGIDGVGSSRRGGEVVVDIAGDVLFDSGSIVLKSSAKQSLNRVADVLNSQYGGQTIRVEGYTDTDPIKKSSWKTNERLSAERAMAVEAYLVSRGVSNERIYSAAFGPAKQKGSKKESRRVEIVILGSR